MCVCSRYECLMDPDSRGRWIYDYSELQQRWTRKYLSNHGKNFWVVSSQQIQRGFSFRIDRRIWNRHLTLTRLSQMFSDTQSSTCPSDSFVSTEAPARPWQMVLINVDTITRFPAINIHSSYGFKCWGFQIMWLTGVGEGASGRWFEVEDGWSKCESSLWVENAISGAFICAPDSHRVRTLGASHHWL